MFGQMNPVLAVLTLILVTIAAYLVIKSFKDRK